MEEADVLEALSDVLERLTINPYDLSLHAEHIRIAQATGMQDQLISALDMMTAYWAVGDQLWLLLIQPNLASIPETVEELKSLLTLFQRAEEDYLSIPLLQMHLEFLVNTFERYYGPEATGTPPDQLGDMFTPGWMRTTMSEVVERGMGHLTKSHLLWDIWRDWELEQLERATGDRDRQALVQDIETLFLRRLRQPHSNHADTFQAYSTFTTNNKPSDQYEELLVKASKARSQAVKSYERREQYESSLEQAGFSLEGYAYYIAAELRMRQPDLLIVGTLYERAIAEADKRRFANEANAEAALRSFWTGYLDFLGTKDVEEEQELAVFKRALRSVPASGEVWARYMRFLERSSELEEGLESISAAYDRSQSIAPLLSDVEQIVPVVLARAAYERRCIQSSESKGEGSLEDLIQIVMNGIANIRKASKDGDPRLRLEKYLSSTSRNFGSPEHAVLVWEDAVKQYKTSYLAWIAYTDVLIEQHLYDDAREVFRDICMKNLDWPEALWEAWVSFEHLYGSIEQLEGALYRIEKANIQLSARRAKEAQRANDQAAQIIADAQAAATSTVLASANAQSASEAATKMDVDGVAPTENSTKRKAQDEDEPESSKKPRMDLKPVPLKRDRENSTVFVANLPSDVQEDDLRSLFKDCGQIREIKITQLQDTFVATVEFMDRDSVPAALTKDKKRVHGQEVEVHLAWESTLYITNFPEKTDDGFIRELFGKYGTIFDVRWPSKKFKSTRRFCYVQYTSPSSAQGALELHGQELEPDMSLTVLISDPERRKERTDSDANDREVYIAGLSKFVTKEDLEKLFKTYGEVKEVRITLDKDGRSKGFAFVEFTNEKDAMNALNANNFELKKRRIAVTLADTRVRNKNREPGHRAEVRNRSVRIRNLPASTQEGLLQQTLEKYAIVKRVEVFADLNEAEVELENPVEAGKLLLHTEPIEFNGNVLEILAENIIGSNARAPTVPPTTSGMFLPRNAVSRPRAGLGMKKRVQPAITAGSSSSATPSQTQRVQTEKRGQDDFRRMLNGGK